MVLNEIVLILIGMGAALLINLYMPSLDRQLRVQQDKVEASIKHILTEIVEFLRTNEQQWTEKEMNHTARLIKEAKGLAARELENRFSNRDHYYLQFFEVREKQMEILQRLVSRLDLIQPIGEQMEILADAIELISLEVNSQEEHPAIVKKVNSLQDEFKSLPLPETWEMFEARAELLLVFKEFKDYLDIKNSIRGRHQDRACA